MTRIKPILFSTPMVQAILAGRKTMTRRVVKPQPENGFVDPFTKFLCEKTHYGGHVVNPKYAKGDILWVRETWLLENGDRYTYRASEPFLADWLKWRPSIFMPKEACRIWLRVTDVQCERLRDILCGDMKREGCIPETVTGGQYQQWQRDYWIPLWDSINAKRGYGWDANPWVWVISFERCEKPRRLENE
jgi:hypothetical protein